MLNIVRGIYCSILVSALVLEARESPAIRVREALVRTLFQRWYTPSSLSDRFFDRTIAWVAPFNRIRYARCSSTSSLRFVALVAFSALRDSRKAYRSAFLRASYSRTA